MLCGDVNTRELQSVLTLTTHDTQWSYSMVAVGTISDLYDSQTRIKIKAFDPTKPEEYEIWEASFLSTLSARAKASINLGRPTREMAASFVGANRSDYDINECFKALYTDYISCMTEVYDKMLQSTRWTESQEGRSAFATLQRKYGNHRDGFAALEWMARRFNDTHWAEGKSLGYK